MSVFDNNVGVDASGNVTVAGNLTVNGATSTVSTTNTVIADKLIELGNGVNGTPSGDGGIVLERGSSTNAALIWDESADAWVVCTTSATGASTGDLTLTPTSLAASTVSLKEQAAAGADVAAYGQLWVKSNAPNDLYFTNDNGDDVQITNNTVLNAAAPAANDANTILHMQMFV